MKKSAQDKFILDLIEESRGWKHLTVGVVKPGVDARPAVLNANSALFNAHAHVHRGGLVLSCDCFHLAPVRKFQRELFVPAALSATLLALFGKRCTEWFGSEGMLNPFTRMPVMKWDGNSAKKMIESVRRVLKDPTVKYNPVVDDFVEATAAHVAPFQTPMDLIMQDTIKQLTIAVKKGMDRDDLIRMVDEAIAESVMKT